MAVIYCIFVLVSHIQYRSWRRLMLNYRPKPTYIKH